MRSASVQLHRIVKNMNELITKINPSIILLSIVHNHNIHLLTGTDHRKHAIDWPIVLYRLFVLSFSLSIDRRLCAGHVLTIVYTSGKLSMLGEI